MTPLNLAIKISRPMFWIYLLGPFSLGWAAANPVSSWLSTLGWFLVWVFTFALPANIFLYGINDFSDADTDKLNQKKKTHEHLATTHQRTVIKKLLIVTLLWFSILLLIIPTGSKIWLGLWLLLAWAYSSPPLRFKAQPIIDSVSNFLYVIPAIIGYLFWTNQLPSIWLVLAGWLFCMGLHTFSAIPDIQPDKKAGLKTTAVLLGKTGALRYVFITWLLAWLIAISQIGTWITIGFIYPTLALMLLLPSKWQQKLKIASLEEIYWRLPVANTLLGFCLFIMLTLVR